MKHIGIIGGGPAGLMAAEALSMSGHRVTVCEAMPTIGRKFLMAGKSGLNLTHAEPHEVFVTRFGAAGGRLRPMLDAFSGKDVRKWASGLGQETFVGSSGRVFPVAMKASPLLRAWLAQLEARGVTVLTLHRWVGFSASGPSSSHLSPHQSLPSTRREGDVVKDLAPEPPSSLVGEGQAMTGGDADASRPFRLQFDTPGGPRTRQFDAVVLALGGASWPRLGSDAAWVPWLADKGIPIQPFRPANCGFDVAWSDVFSARFAGQPVKSVAIGHTIGEFIVTRTGIEGSLVYMHAAALRDALEKRDKARLVLDMMPHRTQERIARDLERAGSKASLSTRLRKLGLDPVKAALVRECIAATDRADAGTLARRIKALPLAVIGPRPIAEAISTAGGVAWRAVDNDLMLSACPGVFIAGEMLDWEAPTGGYLLTACLATGRWAGQRAGRWLEQGAPSV